MTNATIDPHRIAANWSAIAAEIDAPPLSFTERFLQRLRVPLRISRLIGATPSLRRAWFVAIAVTAVIALGATDASRPRESLFVLLFLAPLVPVFGVTLAYGPGSDPAYEITLATPKSGIKLALIRSGVVLGVTLAILGVASLLTPNLSAFAFAWLLPACATTAATLAAMTTTPPRRAAIAVTGGWTAAVIVAAVASANRLQVFEAPWQPAWAALAVAAIVVAVRRRERFDLMWTSR